MSIKPKWMDRHPCTACGTGYGECAQGLKLGLKCCKDCEHPTRWTDDPPYAADEYAEMQERT